MATLDWELDRTDGVTLVRLYVTADHPRRVRVENRLDGPVWPPRHEGQPVAGWTDDAFEGVVRPDDRLAVGYATPAQPDDPPAEIVNDEPVDATVTAVTSSDPFGTVGDHRGTAPDGGGAADTAADADTDAWTTGEIEQSPAGVVRSLGDPIVPRDAVPVPELEEPPGANVRGATPDDGDGDSADDRTDDSIGDGADAGAHAGNRDSRTGCHGELSAPGDTDRLDGEAVATNGSGDVDAGRSEAADQAGERDERPASPTNTAPGAQLSTDRVPVVPHSVRGWLRDVERRLDAVERRGPGTIDRDETLGVAVTADSRALTRVARRVETLAERAERLQHDRRRRGRGQEARRQQEERRQEERRQQGERRRDDRRQNGRRQDGRWQGRRQPERSDRSDRDDQSDGGP